MSNISIIDTQRYHKTYSYARQVPVETIVESTTTDLPTGEIRDLTRYKKVYSSQRHQVQRIRLVRN